jgi:hypothetical protein
MRPVVKKVEYFLRNGQRMAIVGVLSYDIATKKIQIIANDDGLFNKLNHRLLPT